MKFIKKIIILLINKVSEIIKTRVLKISDTLPYNFIKH